MGGLSFRVRQNATQSSVPFGTVAEIFELSRATAD